MCKSKSMPQKRHFVGKLTLAEIRRMRNPYVAEGGRRQRIRWGGVQAWQSYSHVDSRKKSRDKQILHVFSKLQSVQ